MKDSGANTAQRSLNVRYVFMLLATIAVAGAMVATLILFWRRLRRIEEEAGVSHSHESFREGLSEAIYSLKHRVRRG